MNPIFAMADAGRVLSRPDIEKMIEPLAARVHDAWMRQRQAEGWNWGAVHNAALKQQEAAKVAAQQKEAEKQVLVEHEEGLDTFQRAFSACMDARGYSVK